MDLFYSSVASRLHAFAQDHWVGAGSDVLQAFTDHCLSQHSGGGGAVAGDVVGLDGYFLEKLSAHVFEWIFEIDLTRNRHTIVGDGWCAVWTGQYNVTAFRPKGHADSVSDSVDASFKSSTCFCIKTDFFCHFYSCLLK